MASGMSSFNVLRTPVHVTYSPPAADARVAHITLVASKPNANDGNERRITLHPGDSITLGRASRSTLHDSLKAAATNARFDCPVVSRSHAILYYPSDAHGTITLRDDGSLHGTAVNGAALEQDQPAVHMNDRDVIRLGTEVARGNEMHEPLYLTYRVRWSDTPDPLPPRAKQQSSYYYSDEDEDEDEDYEDGSTSVLDSDGGDVSIVRSSPYTTPEHAKPRSRWGSQEKPIDVEKSSDNGTASEPIVVIDESPWGAFQRPPTPTVPAVSRLPAAAAQESDAVDGLQESAPVRSHDGKEYYLSTLAEEKYELDEDDSEDDEDTAHTSIVDDSLDRDGQDSEVVDHLSGEEDEENQADEHNFDDHEFKEYAPDKCFIQPVGSACEPKDLPRHKPQPASFSVPEESCRYHYPMPPAQQLASGLQPSAPSYVEWNQPPPPPTAPTTTRGVYDPVRNAHAAQELEMFTLSNLASSGPQQYQFMPAFPQHTDIAPYMYPFLPAGPNSVLVQHAVPTTQATIDQPRPKTKISIDDIVAKTSTTTTTAPPPPMLNTKSQNAPPNAEAERQIVDVQTPDQRARASKLIAEADARTGVEDLCHPMSNYADPADWDHLRKRPASTSDTANMTVFKVDQASKLKKRKADETFCENELCTPTSASSSDTVANTAAPSTAKRIATGTSAVDAANSTPTRPTRSSASSQHQRVSQRRRERMRRAAVGVSAGAAGAVLGVAGTVAFLTSSYAEALIQWLA